MAESRTPENEQQRAREEGQYTAPSATFHSVMSPETCAELPEDDPVPNQEGPLTAAPPPGLSSHASSRTHSPGRNGTAHVTSSPVNDASCPGRLTHSGAILHDAASINDSAGFALGLGTTSPSSPAGPSISDTSPYAGPPADQPSGLRSSQGHSPAPPAPPAPPALLRNTDIRAPEYDENLSPEYVLSSVHVNTGDAANAPRFAYDLDLAEATGAVAVHSPSNYEASDAAAGSETDPDDQLFDDDETFTDTFSNYGSSLEDDTQTLNTEAEREHFFFLHGRRYNVHGNGQYMIPADDLELDREDMKHHFWTRLLDGKLHLSPIPDHPTKILDVGTGSGIWAMQAADKYPSAEVIGFDISPLQPKWVPPNLSFEVDDLEQEWLWGSESCDFVHVRFMFMSIKDWPQMLVQAYRTLKPGGYIELSELDLDPHSLSPDQHTTALSRTCAADAEAKAHFAPPPPNVLQWFTMQGEILLSHGFNMRIAKTFKRLLEDAGFEGVVEDVRDVPWGTWAEDARSREVGYWHLEQLKQGLSGIIMTSLTRAGWSFEKVEVFLVGLRKEMDDLSWRIKDQGLIVYARKPSPLK